MKELHYVSDHGWCETPCPVKLKNDKFSQGNPEYYHGVMVGSSTCTGHHFFNEPKACPWFQGEIGENTILCNHPDLEGM